MDAELEDILRELTAVRADLIAAPAAVRARLDAVHPTYRASARNLVQYLALRRRDLRPLQLRLAALGLSSLGRAESHVLATVDAVIGILNRLAGQPAPAPDPDAVPFAHGERLLDDHADALLGPAPAGRGVRIMVTMPGQAATDYALVHDLVRQGMDCVRINCAHDDPDTWGRIIAHLRRAEGALGRSCRVVMDLAGPKLRTGPLEPGPAVVKVRPKRNPFGRVTAPARIWLTASETPQPPPAPADATVQVPADWLADLRVGEVIGLVDARKARRRLRVADVTPGGCWVRAKRTTYLVPGTVLRRPQVAAKAKRKARVGDLPPGETAIPLAPGDLLVVTRDLRPGRPAAADSTGKLLTPAAIGCSLPEVFDDVKAGEAIWFDDGKIGGVVEAVEAGRAVVRITRTPARGAKLRADKGINLPDSQLRLPALTEKDLEDLAFAAEHADVVELSFANTVRDVDQLQRRLAQLGRQPAVVLKIETRQGFVNLPDMLLAAMRSPCCGVMIARGDLAVESGFERLAEVQEEILWICEAAHVPVIWATQVLETLAREGMPSRAEITDAAMGHRAECVMLNKGPHVRVAVKALDDILRRMEAHQSKKRAMLRELRLAHSLDGPPAGAAG